MFEEYSYLNEDAIKNVSTDIKKNVYTINLGKTVGIKIVYKFYTLKRKLAGIIFTQNENGYIVIKSGAIDYMDKIIGPIYLDKTEIKNYFEIKNKIFNRFLIEHPNYYKFLM